MRPLEPPDRFHLEAAQGWLELGITRRQMRNWLKKAVTINEHTVKRAAIDDPDFKPLWDSIADSL